MINIEIMNQIRKKNVIPIIIIASLLFLRFPLTIVNSLKIIKIPNASDVYVNYTYLLTACLIIYEKDKLKNFNIGFSTITVFILLPILKPIIYLILKNFVPWKEDLPFSWFQIVVAAIFLQH